MKLLSVNISMPKPMMNGGKPLSTGIFKEPVQGRIRLRKLNLDGDGQADLKAHGGIYKAAYVYSAEHYRYWKTELGREDLGYGQFGENFTVEGMLEDDVHIGDVFRMGEAVVEVTQPRVPCNKLAVRMESPDLPKKLLASGRTGFYVRVLQEGEVGAGDDWERLQVDPEALSVREAIRLLYFDEQNLEGAKKALRIEALSPGWRSSFEQRLLAAGIRIDYSDESTEGRICGP